MKYEKLRQEWKCSVWQAANKCLKQRPRCKPLMDYTLLECEIVVLD